MKKKLMAVALAAVALVATFGTVTAFAATSDSNFWAARGEARANVTDEQREERWAMRNNLFTQFFGDGVDVPVRSDEAIAERQAFRFGFAEQFHNDGVISQELFDIMISSMEADRTEFNAEERMANRNALWGQISEDGISFELIDSIISARANGERTRGGGRGGWLWQ